MTKATGPLFDVHFRRRREGRTNYVKRLRLLKGGAPRLVIRKSNAGMLVQLVEFDVKGDKTVTQVSTKDLKTFGFTGKRNVPSAYLIGFLVARKAAAKKVSTAVADFGMYTASKGSVLFAVVKGAIDGGLKINVEEDKLPSKDRLNGKHINIDITPVIVKIKEAKV